MSEETQILKIDKKPGLTIGRMFVPYGKTCNVPKTRAEQLVKNKRATLQPVGTAVDFPDLYSPPSKEKLAARKNADGELRDKEASELLTWPAYMQLNKGGLTTVEGLKTFIAESPKDWDAKLELTAEDKAAVEAELKKVGKKSTAKPTE